MPNCLFLIHIHSTFVYDTSFNMLSNFNSFAFEVKYEMYFQNFFLRYCAVKSLSDMKFTMSKITSISYFYNVLPWL